MDRRGILRLRVDRCRALGLRIGRQRHDSERERRCSQSCCELSHRILLSFGVGEGDGEVERKTLRQRDSLCRVPRRSATVFRYCGGGMVRTALDSRELALEPAAAHEVAALGTRGCSLK